MALADTIRLRENQAHRGVGVRVEVHRQVNGAHTRAQLVRDGNSEDGSSIEDSSQVRRGRARKV